jgi:hypothetical protein
VVAFIVVGRGRFLVRATTQGVVVVHANPLTAEASAASVINSRMGWVRRERLLAPTAAIGVQVWPEKNMPNDLAGSPIKSLIVQ